MQTKISKRSIMWPPHVSALVLSLTLTSVYAQSDKWDAQLSNTSWYVPISGLISYAALNPNNFTMPPPIAAGDQTLWKLSTFINGNFSGISDASLALGSAALLSKSNLQGSVNNEGKIRITFTDQTSGVVTLGMGNMQNINGIPLMEMQMITGTGLLLTHWAYMTPYNPASYTPPSPQQFTVAPIASPQWSWTAGTPWKITSASLFGSDKPGNFIITNYNNGYFLGQGIGPKGSSTTSFTQLGSMTPEGAVLFNTIANGKLTSLLGQISGGFAAATIQVSDYGFSGTTNSDSATLTLVAPYALTARAENNPSATGAAHTLYNLAGSTAGLYGEMAPIINVLNDLSGKPLSTALSQTTPVLVGAASQATYNMQRGLQQTALARLDNIRGTPSGENFAATASGHAWIKPFGNWTSQNNLNDVSGYSGRNSGIAIGTDKILSEQTSLGVVAAFSNALLNTKSDGAPTNLGVTSYQIGSYGAHALSDKLDLDYQLNFALNNNRSNRSIDFMGTSAQATYNSYTYHAGLGLKSSVPISRSTYVIPALRLDYAAVNANAYNENGAGPLNLNVSSQTYQELMMTADLRADTMLTDQLKLSINGGIGYNALNNQTQITASFMGGGESFVTQGIYVSPWMYHAGIGLVTYKDKSMEIGLRYDVQATPSGYLNQMASLKLKYAY